MPGVAAGRRLRQAGPTHRLLDGLLQDRFVQMVPPTLTRRRIHVGARRREQPVPSQLAPGVRILPHQRIRQRNPAVAAAQIGLMLPPNSGELLGQRRENRAGIIVTRSLRPLPSRTRSRARRGRRP
jgi:hypothetical protein